MRLDPHHRDIVAHNLEIAFPDWTPQRRAEATRAAFTNWGRLGGELAHVDALLAAPRTTTLLELDRLLTSLADPDRGLLVLSAHTANFELLARMAGAPNREILLFHRAMSNELVNQHLEDARRRAGLGTLGRGAAVREAMRVLARGGIIVAPLDQNQPPGRGIFVDMFGRPASTSTFLARLSMASGASVLPVFAVWDDDGGLSARTGKPIAPPQAPTDRKAAAAELTQRYTREIEAAVRAQPKQWNWAHRRWKTRPPSEAANPAEPFGPAGPAKPAQSEITPATVELNEPEAHSQR